MSQTIHNRLKDLGVILPTPAIPAANYVPFTLSDKTLYISGQLPFDATGQMLKGCLGKDVSIEQGQAAAKLCAIGILAQVNRAVDGDFDKIARCLKLGAFVASMPDFFDQPKVVNGASDFMVAVLGDAGRHARFAVGVSALPFGAAVEIDAIFEMK